jgi:hypothetical protein
MFKAKMIENGMEFAEVEDAVKAIMKISTDTTGFALRTVEKCDRSSSTNIRLMSSGTDENDCVS